MGKHTEDDYIFPSVVIRSNEVNLLSQEDLEHVMEQKSVQQAMNMLFDFGYGDGKEMANPRDFEKALKKNLEDAYELVYSIAPDEQEIDMFLFPNDYHNCKVLLKAEILKTDPDPYLVHSGTVSPETMKEMIRKRDYSLMSVEMRNGIEQAIDLYSKSHDPQEIDINLDRACYRDMQIAAQDSENEFVQEYVMKMIDIMNVTTMVRLRETQKPRNFYQKVFLEGGNFDFRYMDSIYEENYASLAEKLGPFGFHDLLAVGAEETKRTGKFTELERLADNMKMAYVKDSQLVPFGIEPLVGYLTAKEMEVKNLRIVLTGKIAGTPDEVTKERLRETYV